MGGHALGSFKERGSNHVWLRDALPYDLCHEIGHYPMARIMTHGYDSTVVSSQSIQNLEDLAVSLRNSLLPLVNAPTTKPIVFIAHSLGGLILKQVR